MKKLFTILTLPLAACHSVILAVRHFLYDQGIFKSQQARFSKIICVGNLELGGTGKTPTTIFLAKKLVKHGKVAVLSRGYRRKSQGFQKLSGEPLPDYYGDEPLLIYNAIKEFATVQVCEKRAEGIDRIEKEQAPDFIILDDAYQHRAVKSDVSILLTPYQRPYFQNYLYPAGTLRDVSSRAQEANLVLVSGSPEKINQQGKEYLEKGTGRKFLQTLFAGTLQYSPIQSLFAEDFIKLKKLDPILVVTAIANPERLIMYLKKEGFNVSKHLKLRDHHPYTEETIHKAERIYDNFAGNSGWILTTEKDAVKIRQFAGIMKYPEKWLVQPVELQIEGEEEFEKKILSILRRDERL